MERKTGLDEGSFDKDFEKFLDSIDMSSSDFREENKPFIDSSNIYKNQSGWRKATYAKGNNSSKNQKSLNGFKKTLVIAMLSALGYFAYQAGYNSEFAKHFWDDTKDRLEERKIDMEEYESLAKEAENKVISNQERETR